MPKNADWIPTRRVDQLGMAKTWVNVIGSNAGNGNWHVEEYGELTNLAKIAEELFETAMSADRNAVITARVNTAFSNMVTCMRNIKNRRFFVPPLTDADLVSLGLHSRDETKTTVHEPAGQATAEITYPGVHLLMLHLKAVTGSTDDPRADYGYRVHFGVMPAGGATAEEATGHMRYLIKAAVTGEDLPHSRFTRRRRLLMEFPAADSGKTAYFAIRFENAKGGKGPWGPVFSAIIP